ncbi:MAG: hypothetical protein F6K11_13235 [Leptolyngbya sp. SIO3F4]|nr:hypothetical protein [Leptolyngbya sp. SIO3F4]
MITRELYDILIPRHILEDRYAGGVAAFQSDFPADQMKQDDYLFCLHGKNATAIRPFIDRLTRSGIAFDEVKNESADFTVLAKEGLWWKVPWLVHNYEGAWFIADVEAPV